MKTSKNFSKKLIQIHNIKVYFPKGIEGAILSKSSKMSCSNLKKKRSEILNLKLLLTQSPDKS